MAAVPQDLLDRVRALERQVRELTGRAQIRPALNRINHGRVTIAEGGSLEVLAPDGTGLFGVGQLGSYWNHPDGSPQQGLMMQREDGTTAFTIRASPTAGAGGALTQAVSIWDRTGHIVMGDDTTSGRGIGSPALPMPFQKLPAGGEPIETSTFQNTWFASIQAHNPVAVVQLEFAAAPGATAEVQVQYRLGSETNWTNVDTDTVSAAASASSPVYKTTWFTWPLDRAEFEQAVFVRIQTRQKSGSGGALCNCLGGYTRRTYGPSEIPDPPPSTLATARTLRAAADEVGPGEGIAPPHIPPPFPTPAPFAEPKQPEPPAPTPEPGLHPLDE
ncbi:hypothetical protein [Streptomyces evansiae]|uniref:hypothetical protein n=1 Tax=Streptomyces evansiae TaxID=3075535 RepID=UPI00288789F8|nr:hypothetical protein [Streptomyces sp. DSM 41859]MDT0423512.1 hypothetical protein [Streptomyces sp. DSM 41859]